MAGALLVAGAALPAPGLPFARPVAAADPIPTTTTLQCTPGVVHPDDPIHCTYTVTPNPGGGVIQTSGRPTYGTLPLLLDVDPATGTADVDWTIEGGIGTYAVTGSFHPGGGSNPVEGFAPSWAEPVAIQLRGFATSIGVEAPATVPQFRWLTVTARVTAEVEPPSGSVTFFALGPGGSWSTFRQADSTGRAEASALLAPGTYEVFARFGETARLAASESEHVTTVVVADTGPPVLDADVPGITATRELQVRAVGTCSDAEGNLDVVSYSVSGARWMDAGGLTNGPFEMSVYLGDLDAAVGAPDGPRTIRFRARDRAGNESTIVERTVTLDRTAPYVWAPTIGFRRGASASVASVPATVAWSVVDRTTAVAAVDVLGERDGVILEPGGGTLRPSVVEPQASAVPVTMSAAGAWRFGIRATDVVGNVSAPRWTALARVLARDDPSTAIHWTGTWLRAATSRAWGGSTRHASRAGATAWLSFTGRSVALVAPRGPTRGSARVYVDGIYAGTVSTWAATSASRQLVFARTWPTAGTHRIEVRVAGTAGHPRVDVDAFLVLR